MNEFVEEFLTENAFSKGTQDNYRRFPRFVLTWVNKENLDLEKLRPGDFLEFLQTRNWSTTTEYHCWHALKSYLKWLYGKTHPALRLRIRREAPGPQRTLDFNEVRQLINSIDANTRAGKRDLPMVHLMLDTGLRASELCRLELRHLDLTKRMFSVRGKGGRWRVGVFSELTRAYLATWLLLREKVAKPNVANLFVSMGGTRPGTALTSDGLRSIFRALGAKSGLPNLSPHAFRRTFATLAIRQGASSRLVQVAGGWHSLLMVERYTQAIRAEDFENHFATNVLAEKGCRPGDSQGGRSEETKS